MSQRRSRLLVAASLLGLALFLVATAPAQAGSLLPGHGANGGGGSLLRQPPVPTRSCSPVEQRNPSRPLGDLSEPSRARPTAAVPSEMYSVTFNETGLAPRTNWSVTLNGSLANTTTSTNVFDEPNGTYNYSIGAVSGYTSNVTKGNVTVNATSANISIRFTPTPALNHTVAFREMGLPVGTKWSVTLNGTSLNSTDANVTFAVPNGTYHYVVGTITGFTANNTSGPLLVKGTNVTVWIGFTMNVTSPIMPPAFPVEFVESGLATGAVWVAVLNGTAVSSANSTVDFDVPNGTLSFTIAPLVGYTSSPSSGTVMVAGGPVSESITFTPAASSVGGTKGSSSHGLPQLTRTEWYLVVAAVAAAGAVGAVFLVRGRVPRGPTTSVDEVAPPPVDPIERWGPGGPPPPPG
jgi:hypothetical protein